MRIAGSRARARTFTRLFACTEQNEWHLNSLEFAPDLRIESAIYFRVGWQLIFITLNEFYRAVAVSARVSNNVCVCVCATLLRRISGDNARTERNLIIGEAKSVISARQEAWRMTVWPSSGKINEQTSVDACKLSRMRWIGWSGCDAFRLCVVHSVLHTLKHKMQMFGWWEILSRLFNRKKINQLQFSRQSKWWSISAWSTPSPQQRSTVRERSKLYIGPSSNVARFWLWFSAFDWIDCRKSCRDCALYGWMKEKWTTGWRNRSKFLASNRFICTADALSFVSRDDASFVLHRSMCTKMRWEIAAVSFWPGSILTETVLSQLSAMSFKPTSTFGGNAISSGVRTMFSGQTLARHSCQNTRSLA